MSNPKELQPIPEQSKKVVQVGEIVQCTQPRNTGRNRQTSR